MAFMEGKLQPIDLLGAWQARQQRERMERDSAAAVDPAMDNLRQRMAAEQLKAAELANKRAEFDMQPSVMTVSPAGMPGLTAQGMGSSKQFVSDAPGYMSGVSTTDLMKEKGDTVRATIAAMASSAGRGGRGGEETNPALNPELFKKNESEDAKMTRSNLAATAEENKTKQGVADAMAMETLRQKGQMDQQESANKTALDIAGMKTADQQDKQAQKDEQKEVQQAWNVRKNIFSKSAEEAARRNGLSREARDAMMMELPEQFAKYYSQGEMLNIDMLAKQYLQRFPNKNNGAAPGADPGKEYTVGSD